MVAYFHSSREMAPMNFARLGAAWSALLGSVLLFAPARADVKLPAVFGDHMVLQQQAKLPVWGTADAGEEVTVSIGDRSASAKADENGRWKVTLDALDAGGPLQMTIKGNNEIVIKDVLVGEVWVCSGQSNMQWSVAQSANPEEEIANAKHPQIRLLQVARKVANEPQSDIQGHWQVCSPETAAGFSAVGYFFGRKLQEELGVPVGLVNSSWGGTIAEAWTSRPTLESDDDFAEILKRAENFNASNPNQASVLWNGMIAPIVPFAIRGAIWYQGESNVDRAEQYAELFPAMITDWRENWEQGDFPFYFVQLAPYRYGNKDPRAMAELRESQMAALELPNTGMAATVDIGNVKDIHPKNKQEVGRRLALAALAETYGQDDLVYSGPIYQKAEKQGDKIRIHFEHVGGGLVTRDGKAPSDFTIAGEDGEFVPAEATIDGDTVIVSSDQVKSPAAVRFAWRDDAEPNLMNKDGLPATPFRTDEFKMVTSGKR
jgi:sialate O-acetylesterase